MLADGREISVPLAWSPRLCDATAEQCRHLRLIGGGIGIHWPDVDEEFTLVLRRAAEVASPARPGATSSAGLTLAEMKAAASEVDFDPALVERVARLLAASTTASPLERLIGGPVRHDHEARFPIKLDENSAARLLSAVRIRAGQSGSRDVGLAVARAYWASSTRKVRERISVVLDTIDRTLPRPETQGSAIGAVGDGAAAAEPDAGEVGPRS